MKATTTNVFTRNLSAYLNKKIRRAVNEGGTSSSKTYSIVQLLIFIAMESKRKILISIVAESLPVLKRGAIRDFLKIMEDYLDEKRWNRSDYIYTFPNGSQIEFFGADSSAKLRGGRRDILYINECNNVAYESFMELDKRTRLFTFLDYNPVAEFWAHEKIIPRPDTEYIHSTYLDAKHVLDKSIIENIESEKDADPNWWHVYGLGLVGKINGLVYPNFQIIEQLQPIARPLIIYGLDFGFSNDPSVLVRNEIRGNDLYSEEMFYETGMTNRQIADRFAEVGVRKHRDVIIADSAEPKSIQELCDYGYNVLPVTKGQGSVEHGIQKVNQYNQFWFKNSPNCIKEQRNCMYIKDKNGNFTDAITHFFSHGMDARRYAVSEVSKVTGFPSAKDWFGKT